MRASTGQLTQTLRRPFARARGRVEFGDALLALYLLVFARQYLWPLDSNALGWALAVPLAFAAWLLYVSTKPFKTEAPGRDFWLLVALPLLLFYMLRLPFPDVSFDVLNYRLLHAERSLRAPFFLPGDFFPTPAPYNPAPDTLTALFRHALGYRLGTIINLLVLVWSAQVVDKILRPFVARARPRALCVLLVMLAEHLLFEVNTYMVDLLALPLLLEATRLTLRAVDVTPRADDARVGLALDDVRDGLALNDAGERDLHAVRAVVESRGVALFAHVAFLLGAAASLKLTNAVVIPPLALVCAYRALAGSGRLAPKRLARALLVSAVAFAAPLLPFCVYLYCLTGNPLFPIANKLFRSPFWPTGGGWDARWGPAGFFETLAWPALVSFEPERHSELAVYSGRLTLGFAAALVGLALAHRDARARLLSAVLLACSLLWAAGGMGYSRYGLYLEVLAGAVLVALASVLLEGARREPQATVAWKNARAVWKDAPAVWRGALAFLLVAALVAQAALACVYACRYEWSMRATAFGQWSAYKYELRYVLRDRSLKAFLTDDERMRYASVGAWAETGVKSTGFEVLLNPSAPVLAFNHEEYFATRESKGRFVGAVEGAPGASLFSLCFPGDLAAAKEFVERRGLSVGRVSNVEVPFFSPRDVIGMMLVEIPRPQGPEGRRRLEEFWRGAAFPEADYRAEIEAAGATPTSMRAGERVVLNFRVRNAGGSVWPARGDAKGWYQVNLGDRWLDSRAREVVNALDARTALPADLPPGGEVTLPLAVNAPREPGDYVLEIDMVHEGVTFFNEKGSKSLRLPLRVEPSGARL